MLLEVERYESLAEELEELGVTTLDDVRAKIRELHQRLDALGDEPQRQGRDVLECD